MYFSDKSKKCFDKNSPIWCRRRRKGCFGIGGKAYQKKIQRRCQKTCGLCKDEKEGNEDKESKKGKEGNEGKKGMEGKNGKKGKEGKKGKAGKSDIIAVFITFFNHYFFSDEQKKCEDKRRRKLYCSIKKGLCSNSKRVQKRCPKTCGLCKKGMEGKNGKENKEGKKGKNANSLFHIEISRKISQNTFLTRQ